MKAITIMMMALIMIPGIFASNMTGIDEDQTSGYGDIDEFAFRESNLTEQEIDEGFEVYGGDYNDTGRLYDNIVYTPDSMTACDKIQEYFSAVNMRLLYLVSFIFLMWLLEPAFKKKVENAEIKPNRYYTKDTLTYLYKFIGLGLMALTIILMFTIAKGL